VEQGGMSLGSYSFLPWMRRGIGNHIQAAAGLGASRASLTAAITVDSEAGSVTIAKKVWLVGPGDLTTIHAEQVIRTEPRAGVADFEPNYLACIDLYDEDFPWRYSPSAPDAATHQLTPWILLAVLSTDEFRPRTMPGRFPAIELTGAANVDNVFPPANQVFAWAHVHLNDEVGAGTTPDLGRLASVLTANPDIGYARLVCPRKLKPNTSYVAFVLPTFEVGRKAGLGETVADTEDGSKRSWEGGAKEFPVFFQWPFRTGIEGDFESLVRALVPRDMDPRVGIRDMSIRDPDFGIGAVSNAPDDCVGLEGALLAPTTVRKGLADTSDFVPKVLPKLNAPADARVLPATPAPDVGEDDPIVAPPIYGCWHAGVDRVNAAPPPVGAGWVNQLNLDPRYRAAAGLGARVIRKHQERYMQLAWQQIGDVLTVNYKIRRAQLAIKAAHAAFAKTYSALPETRALALAAPVLTKVMASPTTLYAQLVQSRTPRAAFSFALRKQLRPRGLPARRLLPKSDRAKSLETVIEGINTGTSSAAPSRPPPGGGTLEASAAAIAPPGWIAWLLRNGWWLVIALVVAALALVAGGALALAAAFAVAVGIAAAAVVPRLTQGASAQRVASMLSPAGLGPESIAAIPPNPTFKLEGTAAVATVSAPVPPAPAGSADNAAARDLRRALIALHEKLVVHVPPPAPRPAFDLVNAQAKIAGALEPHAALAARYAPLLRIGGVDVLTYAARYRDRAIEAAGAAPRLRALQEVMNCPDIKDAMYEPLDGISDEYFVPNLKLVPNNTLSLMQTNQPFIESYLVGLNHEFARELLWREYPTDQRGSCFRQFWDVNGYVDRQGRDAKQLAEDLKDIPRIHEWPLASELGSHNHRDAQGDKSQVVLVIRGDVLKRYPNTYIYAQQATWGTGARENRLVLADETGELFLNNSKDARLRFPLYRARVPPDIHFIGFDLTLEEAKGDAALVETAQARKSIAADKLGWFFVLQEVPGEPRFGLDIAPPLDPGGTKWDKLSWPNLDVADGGRIDLAKPLKDAPGGPDEGITKWGANASDLAFVLYQKPVMVGVHARDMLKNLKATS